MSKYFVNFVAAMCGVMCLGSCAQEVFNEEMSESATSLTVRTRSEDGQGAEVKYPVRLYVFDSGDVCKAVQTIEDATGSLTARLPVGAYSVYALGGADESRYVLPTQENASKSSVIALQSGQGHGDLMAGQSSVTLSEDGSNSLTIGLERKVMLIKSVTIKDVPVEAGNVSVKISKIYQSMLLNGEYQGENGECTIALTKQDDGTTWKTTSETNYQLPSVGKPTITVTIDNDSYSNTCSQELPANHKVSIEGTYKAATPTTPTDVALTGTVTGATWGEDKPVTFDFGPDDTGATTPPANLPEVGSIYNGCYVLSVSGNQATLLSAKEEDKIITSGANENTIKTTIDEKLSNWTIEGISSEWRLPTKFEMDLIYEARNTLGIGGGKTFIFVDSQAIKGYRINKEGYEILATPLISSFLRPVTTITIQ